LDQAAILSKVMEHDEFTDDNDPHGEHDFGAFDHAGKLIFWKIDYYDPSMESGSEDPADPAKTQWASAIEGFDRRPAHEILHPSGS
jgi:Protein of unknown function (DUF3768)